MLTEDLTVKLVDFGIAKVELMDLVGNGDKISRSSGFTVC
jgi:hypothetical protein